jgi:exosortase
MISRRSLISSPYPLLLGLPAALFLTVFWPVLPDLATDWARDPDNSHCFLIPLVSAYFIRKRWDQISWKDARPFAGGLAVLLGALGLYLLSYAGGIMVGQRLALVAVLNGAVLYNFGIAIYRRLLFPMLFLFLMVPVPVAVLDLFAFPLQLFATAQAHDLLLRLGVPVLRAGNILHFPQGSLEVVAACSGIRSLLAFLTLGLIFAYIDTGRWPRKTWLLASTVPIALAANVLRIVCSGLLAFVYGPRMAQGFLHDFSGFALFLLGILIFLAEARLIKDLFTKEAAA